ncbi:MAG: amidohydrolase family protein [Bacteroidota bacterium]
MPRSFFFLTWVALITASCSSAHQDHPLDLLFVGAKVIDGENLVIQEVNVGIQADTIAYVGKTRSLSASQTIDLSGYYLTPGFIDCHTHALKDLSDSSRRGNLNYLLQGVTTVVTGSDGNSDNDIAGRLNHWRNNGIGTNAAILVGHRNIRKLVMGMREDAPTPEELANMKTMVQRGMEAGAIGFSSGLYYSPASFANTEEVIALAEVAAQYGGIYDAHIRDESTYNIGLMAAVNESIQIAEAAKLPVNISHIKCLGTDVWGQSQAIVETINAARARGLAITADQYPYLASGTSLSRALLPKWVFADLEDYTQKFADPALLRQIKLGVKENIRRRGGPASLLLVYAKIDSLNGLNLEEVAKAWDLPAVEAALEVIRQGDANIASFNMNPTDLKLFMQQDWVMTCSDGTVAHPRKYASFPRKIRKYVLEEKVLTLAEMVRRSSGLTAETFQIPRRGKIKEGFFADLLAFKPEEIKDNATFTAPDKLSAGMHYIILNGVVAVEKGQLKNELAGQVITSNGTKNN